MDRISLVFATHNANKAKEVQAMLGDDFWVKTLTNIGVHDEIPETQNTLEGNAHQKSSFIYQANHVNVFSDDTGLEVEALNGEPGVFSARYAGDQKDNDANMDLLLSKLESHSNRKAQFRTVISLYYNDQHHYFEGIVKGEINVSRSGDKGFGYDPIFTPEGYSKTFAEMNAEEKNAISHRGRAIRKMVDFLLTNS